METVKLSHRFIAAKMTPGAFKLFRRLLRDRCHLWLIIQRRDGFLAQPVTGSASPDNTLRTLASLLASWLFHIFTKRSQRPLSEVEVLDFSVPALRLQFLLMGRSDGIQMGRDKDEKLRQRGWGERGTGRTDWDQGMEVRMKHLPAWHSLFLGPPF